MPSLDSTHPFFSPEEKDVIISSGSFDAATIAQIFSELVGVPAYSYFLQEEWWIGVLTLCFQKRGEFTEEDWILLRMVFSKIQTSNGEPLSQNQLQVFLNLAIHLNGGGYWIHVLLHTQRSIYRG